MAIERHSRRSFLQGRAAIGALGRAASEATTLTDPASSSARSEGAIHRPHSHLHPRERGQLVVSVRRQAMACEWDVQLAADRNDDSMEYVFAALDLVEAIEAQLTVYRPDSEVMRINGLADAEPVPVEPRLFELFQQAVRLAEETGGALDLTSAPLSEVWGFSRRSGRLPSDAEVAAALERVGAANVQLDEAAQTVSFVRPGVAVNFNSIGKGHALDRMAELLAGGGVDDYLIHGGRSSVLARGDHPGRPDQGWTIGLRHPIRTDERLAEFRLRDRSLSTSGSATQFFRRRGRTYGHILDPRTGRPAEGIYSATVIAPTAAEADALSTAFYVMGPAEVERFCSPRPEIAALLVCPADREGDVRLHAFGLEAEEWQQFADH